MTSKTTDAAKKAGAKVPQDRAPKGEARNEPIPVSIEVNGEVFSFAVTPDALDDADALEEMSHGIPFKLFRAIAGERVDEFRDQLREEGGRLRVSTIAEFVVKAMQEAGQGKSWASPRS